MKSFGGSMGLPITSLYCGFLAFFYAGITMRVVSFRTQRNVLFGDGGHMPMTRAIRAQANFAELIPFTMLLFGLCELDGALPGFVLHLIGLALFFSRLVHYYGTGLEGPVKCRVLGSAVTITVLSFLSFSLLRYGLLNK
eukprot:jgi/Botrbrau1/3637/Bobra.0204s0028.1